MTGYQSEEYARSLSEFGTPFYLSRAKGWILIRDIPNAPYRDAMGCYPLFSCCNWDALADDLNDLDESVIAFSCVADPFGKYDLDTLQSCFSDTCIPFKPHFVIDLSKPMHSCVSRHHRRKVRSARAQLNVECVEPSRLILEDWLILYDYLIERHAITGIACFSPDSFEKQFKIDGLKVFRAQFKGKTVGMLIWMPHGLSSFYHLGAYSEKGYDLSASYALFDLAIQYFRDAGFSCLNLGGGAGLELKQEDGLARFKEGWASETRTAYLCGKISNPIGYTELSRRHNTSNSSYFPSYRRVDFK